MAQRICVIEGCGRPRCGWGYCRLHYERVQRTGSPHLAKRSLEERFLGKVEKTETCWLWVGGKAGGGYGVFHPTPSKSGPAHRWSYEHFVGPIPPGMHIDHLCRVRACVNPAHLEPVTPRENARRSPLTFLSINARKTHCPKGHLLRIVPSTGHRRCQECALRRDRLRRNRVRGFSFIGHRLEHKAPGVWGCCCGAYSAPNAATGKRLQREHLDSLARDAGFLTA